MSGCGKCHSKYKLLSYVAMATIAFPIKNNSIYRIFSKLVKIFLMSTENL